MATKVTIDGKEYCVETLLHEVKRLKRELTIQAEDNRQSKIGMLTEIQLEFNKAEMHRYDDEIDIAYNTGLHRCGVIIQHKINALKGEDNEVSI